MFVESSADGPATASAFCSRGRCRSGVALAVFDLAGKLELARLAWFGALRHQQLQRLVLAIERVKARLFEDTSLCQCRRRLQYLQGIFGLGELDEADDLRVKSVAIAGAAARIWSHTCWRQEYTGGKFRCAE